MELWIEGGTVVLPDQTVQANLHISRGIIAGIYKWEEHPPWLNAVRCRHLDAWGKIVMPGFVDADNQMLENEMKSGLQHPLPFEAVFMAVEQRMAAGGITTACHTLKMSNDGGAYDGKTERSIRRIRKAIEERAMIRHRIHLCCELEDNSGLERVRRQMDLGPFDLLSLVPRSRGLNPERLKELTEDARRRGAVIVCPGDADIEWLQMMAECGAAACHCPASSFAADFASEHRMSIGRSALDCLLEDAKPGLREKRGSVPADYLCSFSQPLSMIEAVFHLAEDGYKLHEAVRAVTWGPAKALGREHELGTLEVGKKADVIMVERYSHRPVIRCALADGEIVLTTGYMTKS